MSGDLAGPSEQSLDLFGDCWIERPIMARFEMAAALYPNKIAVDDGSLLLSYSELRSAVLHLAHRIEMVASPGSPIGILLANGALFPVATLACIAVGRLCVPVDLNYPEDRNEKIVRDARLAAVIVDSRVEASRIVPAELPHLDVTASLGVDGDKAIAFAPANCPAIVLYTSGSTGRPKGICNDQRAISQRVVQFTSTCDLNGADRFILLSSPGTIAGIRDTFAALLNGATLYIADPHAVGMMGIIRILQDEQITICYAVPALFRALLTLPAAKQACRDLRLLRLGGDIVLASDIELWQRLLAKSCRLLLGYGSTEVPTAFQWFVPNDWTAEAPRVPIGHAQPGISSSIVNDDGQNALPGEIGELVIRSSYLALGSWQNGQLVPGDFLTCADDHAVRILHTGDLLRLREDGLAEFVGRKDRVIKIRGRRADLTEIDEVLRSCNSITDAAVVWDGAVQDPSLIAYVVSNASDARLLAEQLNGTVAARLPGHMRPTQFRLVDAIPRLPSLKPDIQVLAKLDAASFTLLENPARGMELLKDGTVSSRVSVAVEMAWTKILDRNSFVANLPWDQAGGDSLKALRLWFYLEEALHRRLPLDELDARATPRELTAAVANLFNTESAAVNPGQNVRPLVFLMPSVNGDFPDLARFRAAFDGKLRFVVADYLSWREMCRTGARFDPIVDAIVAQAIALGESIYFLAGYSFGGFIAWEVARRLRKSGHRVAFVGLIDTRREELINPTVRRSGRIQRLIYVEALLRQIFRSLLQTSEFPIMHALGNLSMLLPLRASFWFHSRLIKSLRSYALTNSKLKWLDVPVTLFRSDQYRSVSPDFGFGALCAKLEIIPIGGSHYSMLLPPYRESLCKRFMEAVELANEQLDRRAIDGVVPSDHNINSTYSETAS